jgi:hypothetical protein
MRQDARGHDLSTIVERGSPHLAVDIAVKRATRNDIIGRLNAAISWTLARPTVREAFAKLGAGRAGGTPAEFGIS